MRAVIFECGAGALAVGLEQAGLEIAGVQSDAWPILEANRPGWAPILEGGGAPLLPPGPVDVIVCSQPANLFGFVEFACAKAPPFIVLTSARSLLSARLQSKGSGEGFDTLAGSVLDRALCTFSRHGYAVSFNLYDTAMLGAPQARECLVLIARLGRERHPFLDTAPPLTLRGAIGDLDGLEGHVHLAMPKRMTGTVRPLAWDAPCPALAASPVTKAAPLIHPGGGRPLSVQEYARIQGFPDDWAWEGADGGVRGLYRAIASGESAHLGRAIGACLLARGGERAGGRVRFSGRDATDHGSWRAEFCARLKALAGKRGRGLKRRKAERRE